MSERPLRIMGLSGEYRPTSKSGMMVEHALAIAEASGAEIIFWDCNEKPLPFVGEDGCWDNANVKELQETASCSGTGQAWSHRSMILMWFNVFAFSMPPKVDIKPNALPPTCLS